MDKNNYTKTASRTDKKKLGGGWKKIYENRFKDCAVFSVCLVMTPREPPEFLTP